MLRRKRINKNKTDFHTADELIRHVFDAVALRALEVALGTADITKLDAPLDKCEFDKSVMDRVEVVIRDSIYHPDEEGCMASRNVALFMRDMILYLELSAVIKAGDIGRIEEVLKWITILFQAGTT
ncbi:hypothetical protein BGX20_007997, partial [Mortierella sp. AD010]